MKAEEAHKLSDEELRIEEGNLRKKLFEMRCQAVTEKLENPQRITQLRRDLARVLTERNSRRAKEKV